jgi:membrane associated rhomboid family serine protease
MLPIGDDDSQIRTTPIVNYVLIAVNILVFIVELVQGDVFIVRWAFVPSRFMANPLGDWITIFSSMFMHAGLLHIVGNMLYLRVFGNNVEDRFGHIVYLSFYLFSGVAATISQLYFSLGSDIPNLGASGAIAGVLGAYLLMFPFRRVTVILVRLVVPLPAIIVLGFWFLLQFFSGVGSIAISAETGGVAYMAHVGGFVTGFFLAIFFRSNSIRG